MQGEAAGRAGEPSGQGEETPPQGLGGGHVLAQTGGRSRLWAMIWTASQAPFGRLRIGGEAARWQVVEPHAVLQVADGVLDLRVAAMVGLQFQGFPVPVGDEGVIAVGGEEGQLRTGRGLHPPDDEPRGCGVGLTLEGGVEPVSKVSNSASV